MPGLQSKWAKVAEETEIEKAPAKPASPKPAPPKASPSKPSPKTTHSVISKWASADSDEEKDHHKQHKPRPKKNEVQVPTPPTSARGGDVLDLTKSFGDKVGIKDEKRRTRRNRNRDSRESKDATEGKSRKHSEEHADAWEDVSEEELFEDKLYEKGPMTDAAKSLAMRIGAPSEEPKVPKAPKAAKERPSKDAKLPREQNPRNNKAEPKGKYMTPKQKKLEEERQKQEKLKAEQAEKDRKIREEVRQMFELMEDKSTNWADIDE